MNTLKTTFLLSLLTVLMVLMGSAIGGKTGMVFAFFLAAAMNFFSYWFSDRIVLAMYGAREITENDNPSFYGMVRRLAVQAGLPMPRVYLIPSDSPNAFATGRNPSHAAVDRQSVDRLLPAPALFHAPSHGRADRQAGSNSAWWQTGVAVETYPDR